jgi:hypothetical protein
MNKRQQSDDDRLACFVCTLNLSGLTMTKVILWLLALTIVSFVIGFGILALSGQLPVSAQSKVSPFRHSALSSPNTTSFALDGASEGRIDITLGAGEFSLRGGASDDTLLEATVFSRAPEWQPEYLQTRNGTQKTVTMTDRGHTGKEWVAVHSPNHWVVLVGNRVPVDLTVRVGAGDNTLDLSSLEIRSLTVNTGAGDTEIDLSRYHGGAFPGWIHNGIGDLTVRVPKESNTRIHISQGVGDTESSGCEQQDGTFTTPGYRPAVPGTEIRIEQGVGDIRIEAV